MHGLTYVFAALFLWLSTLFGMHYGATLNYAIVNEPKPVRLLFGGDMMFDRTIRTAAAQQGGDYLFSCIDPVLKGADLVVANLEGPITSNASKSVGSSPGDGDNFTFTFPTSTAKLLATHGIDVVSIGNNHIENFGVTGEHETERWLSAAGVDFFGDTVDQSVATAAIGSVRLAFINFNQFARSSSASTTISQITAARERGALPIVYTHWGDEYVPATALERELAHAFVDAGAAAVIGSHPHVVQEHEAYHGSPIYYSLGNFIFDQYFSDAVRHGLLVELTIGQGGVTAVREIPIELDRDRRTCPARYVLG